MLPQLFQMCFTIGFSKDLKSQRLSSVIIGSSPAGWLSKTLNGSTLCAEWIFVNPVFTQIVIFSMFCFLAYLVLLYACSLLYRLVCPCLKHWWYFSAHECSESFGKLSGTAMSPQRTGSCDQMNMVWISNISTRVCSCFWSKYSETLKRWL